jgi:hypothetical protein
MRTRMLAGVVVGALMLFLVHATSGQVQPVPGPGTGVVTVQGEVDVRRMPLVDVGQRGEWKVLLAAPADTRVLAMPAVAIARPLFVKQGARYAITWTGGEQETIVIAQAGDGAWVRATVNGRDRWLNLAHARAVDEMP